MMPTDLPDGARRIGYARVSTKSQRLDIQMDALARAACDPIFSDHGVSGAKAQRPGLDEALEVLRAGDVFVVFKLCRLGRSVVHLADLLTRFNDEGIHFCSLSEGINTMTPGGRLTYYIFSAMAEFQRDLIRENTLAGLEAAKERGVRLGAPCKLDEQDIRAVHDAVYIRDRAICDVAKIFGVSRSTITRGLTKREYEDA